jgi:UDP-N-acetylmuramate--alanine ligase
MVDHRYVFDLVAPALTIEGLTLPMPGLINVENAVAAAAVGLLSGVSPQEIKMALAHFKGIKRRFDVQVNAGGVLYIDDYAHHPEEIRGLVSSVKKLYPNRKVLGIFQPHLYSRTRDFADGFAESLGLLDAVILLPIYPAREEPIPGVDSGMILDKVQVQEKRLMTKSEVIDGLMTESLDIVLTIGAGDIDQLVEPMKNALLNRINKEHHEKDR